jgi:hypothetical protein
MPVKKGGDFNGMRKAEQLEYQSKAEIHKPLYAHGSI